MMNCDVSALIQTSKITIVGNSNNKNARIKKMAEILFKLNANLNEASKGD